MPAPSANRTTRFEYDVEGNLRKLTAENAETGDQVTEWIYGVGAAQGSELESASLLYQKVYPGGTGGADRVTYRYNRQGQVRGMTDQAGTQHDYSFDKLGRITEDNVTAFGPGIDSTVATIARSYEVRGMLETVTSLRAGGTPLNQVQLSYNDYSQLTADYQAHSGVVNPSTTLQVGYSYADGSANTVRRTGLTYPDGAVLATTYGGTAADALSRPDALSEGSSTLCSYRYLGRGTVIGVKYDAASNVELTYQDGGTGGAGDPYTGLDRFGRLIETLWEQGGAQPVRSQYGRNRFSGVVWRRDAAAHAQGVSTEDSYYLYDGLYQVQDHRRGELTGTAPNYTGITNLQQEEEWTYDPTGNWAEYDNSSPANTQSRTHNEANEITLISAAVGNVTPSYDPAGNMTTLPKAPGSATGQYALTWDAWNRLVAVQDGSTPVASYSYDGLTRRLTKTNATETRHYYYNDQWRALEERVAGASVAVERRYAWGLRDRWDLLRRQRSTGGGSLNETHFVLRDYLDPVAIVGPDGLVKERYRYDAFGRVSILAPDYTARTASSFAWDFLFHAEFQDPDTGLYNYGYRYYDTGLGRWLSRDPIGEEGGLNLICFVDNKPPFSCDFLGLAYQHANRLPSISYTNDLPDGTIANTVEDVTHTEQNVIWDSPNGDCRSLRLSGKATFSIRIRFGWSFDSPIGTPSGTLGNHEMRHVKILADLWDEFADEANKYERTYCCPGTCANDADAIVSTLDRIRVLRGDLNNIAFHESEYGILVDPKELAIKRATYINLLKLGAKLAEQRRQFDAQCAEQ